MKKYYFDHEVGVVCVDSSKSQKSTKELTIDAELIRSEKLYIPDNKNSTGRIADIDEYQKVESPTNKTIMGKAKADGSVVPVNSAFATSSLDCPVVVISHPSRLVVAFRAEIRSLIDFEMALTFSPSRTHFSVVDSAMSMFRKKDINPDELHISVHGAIGNGHFLYPYNNPKYGGRNKALLRYIRNNVGKSVSPTIEGGKRIYGEGRIDLHELIDIQLKNHGVDIKKQVHRHEILSGDTKKHKVFVMVWCLESNWSSSSKSEYG